MSTFESVVGILRTTLFETAGTPISVATLITSAIIIMITLLLSGLAQRGVRRWLGRRGVTDEGSIAVTARLLHYLFLFVGFGIAVHTVGINLNALFAAGAIVQNFTLDDAADDCIRTPVADSISRLSPIRSGGARE